MKILITSLLLFTGLNQVLARSLPWLGHTQDVHENWLDDDYDLFRLPSSPQNEDFYTFGMSDRSEKLKELEGVIESAHNLNFLGTSLGLGLDIGVAETNSNENTQNKSDEKRESDDDDEKKLWDVETNDENSSEEKPNFIVQENTSSEERKAFRGENDKSNEDSDEVTPNFNVDIFDLTKSSEEHQKAEDKSSTADVLESFQAALSVVDHMEDIFRTAEPEQSIDRNRETDEILKILNIVMERAWEQDLSEKEPDDTIDDTITAKNESDEEDDSNESATTTTTTTARPEPESKENNDDDNKSNSNEDESNLIYIVLKDFDGKGEQPSPNEHKYSVIDSQPEFMTTSAPYTTETNSAHLSTPNAQGSIKQYAAIREKLDAQQDLLKKHELDLDDDFYAIISNKLDDNIFNKFESDIYAAQENLYRIKQNINAIQNLQTKLYFQKLVTTAVREAQNESVN